MPQTELLLSCEHGGNRVPAAYRELFAGQAALLATHRGYDIGALAAARHLRDAWGAPLVAATTTRLLVDLNRSPGHHRRFSEFTRSLPAAERARILARHYAPYRDDVAARVAAAVAAGRRVWHVSVHSFVAALDGQERGCDVGLLYDPSRPMERRLGRDWQAGLRRHAPGLRVRRNFPYRGVADGLVTALRRQFGPRQYAGLELELNQALAEAGGAPWRQLLAALAASLPARHQAGMRAGRGIS